MQPEYDNERDPEVWQLTLAISAKDEVIDALNLAAKARQERGDCTLGLADSIELERMTRDGYARAREQRLAVLNARRSRR